MSAVVIIPKPLRLLCDDSPEFERRSEGSEPSLVGIRVRLRLLSLYPVFRGSKQAALVPLCTRTRLPPRRAEVAKLVAAPARHVEAAVRQLDKVATARAALPARLTREGEHALVGRARTAQGEGMCGGLAVPARLGPAFQTG